MYISDDNDNGNQSDGASSNEIWSISDCIFCNKKLTSNNEFKRSKLLQCLHAICYNCFNNWDERVDKQCTVCSFYSKKKDVTDNKVLAEMVIDEDETSNEDVCTIHNVPVTHWCIDCAELICEDCVKHHGQLKSTQNHKIQTRKEYLNNKSCSQRSIFPCTVHPQNDLSIVCHTCKIMTCRDCQLEMHKDHKYDFISDSVTSSKTELFDIYKKVEYGSVVLKSALIKISEREEKLEMIKKTLVSDIKKEFDLLQELLKKRCESLMLTAIEKANKKIEDCEINRRVIQKNFDLIQHCLKFVKLVLYSSSDAVLFYTKDLIINHLKRINIAQSIPNSADVINLKFSTQNIDEAKKKIETCGAIHENEDIASIDKKYLFAVYSALISIYKAKADDLKLKKDKHGLPDDPQSTSSPAIEKALPIAPVAQQSSHSSAGKKLISKDIPKSPSPEETQRQQVMQHQLWHIPETMSIPSKTVQPGSSSHIGNNIKKVRLQLQTENSTSSAPKPSDNNDCSVSSSDDVEIIDEIMTVLNEMEKRNGPLPGLPRQPEQLSPPDFQNESWCSVCLKGGNVVCCDNCPKVFHIGCHIPDIKLPSKDCLFPVKNSGWRCLLCQDLQPLQLDGSVSYRDKLQKELKIACRLLLELYCQVEASNSFRYPNRTGNGRGICLGDIKNNLISGKYLDIMSFVKDVRYMFACCFHYEQQDYMKIAHSRSLEEIFNRLLSQYVPCNKLRI